MTIYVVIHWTIALTYFWRSSCDTDLCVVTSAQLLFFQKHHHQFQYQVPWYLLPETTSSPWKRAHILHLSELISDNCFRASHISEELGEIVMMEGGPVLAGRALLSTMSQWYHTLPLPPIPNREANWYHPLLQMYPVRLDGFWRLGL